MPGADPYREKATGARATGSFKNSQNSLKSPNYNEANDFYEFGPFRLYSRPPVLLKDGAVVPLTPKVLDTLKVLVLNAGRPVSKDELLRSVWPDTFVEEGN